jgi:hypothetical protein
MPRYFAKFLLASPTCELGHTIAYMHSCTHFGESVEGKRKGSGEGAGGARGKLLGPYLVPPRPSCIAFEFGFPEAPNRHRNAKMPGRQSVTREESFGDAPKSSFQKFPHGFITLISDLNKSPYAPPTTIVCPADNPSPITCTQSPSRIPG